MRTSEGFKKVLCSWDIWLSAVVTLGTSIAFRDSISYETAKEAYAIAIPLLATVFSIYFAALAILITAGDNEFIEFLQEHDSFSQILWTFRVTLWLLFGALMLAIALFVSILKWANEYPDLPHPWAPLRLFTFLSLYALFAASSTSADAIRMAELRVRFIKVRETWLARKKERSETDNSPEPSTPNSP